MSPRIPVLRLRTMLLLLVLAVALLVVGQLIRDTWRAHPDSYAGLPRPQTLAHWQFTHVLDKPGFVIGYSECRRNPRWVAYRLEAAPHGPIGRRPEDFRVDRGTLARVSPGDYRGSGYDRGHLAPNYAMARFFGRDAQLASFAMSNIVPQSRRLNQKLWQRLEEVEADFYVEPGRPLWVVTGPVFDAERETLAGGVEVPDAFYRIWLREDAAGRPQALAFLVPQQVRGDEPLDRYLVSVDAIEAATGLDFFHRLEDVVEARLEAAVNPPSWGFARHAEHPPRY